MYKKTILYILPHHDDEVFAIPKITYDIGSGHTVKFFFLMKSSVRFKESKNFLNYLGVANDCLFTPGEKLNVSDGFVHLHMNGIYHEIITSLEENKTVDEIVCTAFEGGHHDHDTASVIARRLACDFKCKVSEFYLYNGYGTQKKYYKVAHPVNLAKNIEYCYTSKDYIAVFIAPFFFLSQLNTMIGLWPFLLLQIIRYRALTLNQIDYRKAQVTPGHLETPLYERWGRITQDKLNENILPKIVK